MQTILTRSPRKAAALLRAGEVVAFPTETVYGLGADLFQEEAVRRIFAAKRRPADNPTIAHLHDLTQLSEVVRMVTPAAEKLIAAFFPGPLTLVLPKGARVPLVATAGLETIGVRLPRHPVASAFLRACATPIAAPSANLSGRPSPTTWRAVAADLAGRIGCILKGDRTEVGLESTVVDCTGRTPVVLRAGAVTLEQLREIIPRTRPAPAQSGALARSPGTKYRHYSPRARVRVISHPAEIGGAEKAAYIGLQSPAPAKPRLKCLCRDVAEYARELFAFYRACDEAGITTIYCQRVAPAGLGLALMDRIERAAAG